MAAEKSPRNRFDEAASQWDSNPARVELARAVGAAMLRAVPVQPGWRAVDYGAGTGLLTLNLQPHLASILALDSSTGMLGQLKQKVAATGIENVQTAHWDLEAQPFSQQGFDLVISSMTLHHLRDVPLVFDRFVILLKPGGWLAVADLDAEDGSFHTDPTAVFHHGFDRSQIAAWLEGAGLSQVTVTNAHSITRPSADGLTRTYGVFLGVGQKPAKEGA